MPRMPPEQAHGCVVAPRGALLAERAGVSRWRTILDAGLVVPRLPDVIRRLRRAGQRRPRIVIAIASVAAPRPRTRLPPHVASGAGSTTRSATSDKEQ